MKYRFKSPEGLKFIVLTVEYVSGLLSRNCKSTHFNLYWGHS